MLSAVALAGVLATGAAPAASAADVGPQTVAEVAAALSANPLYVDPALAAAFSDEQVSQLDERLGQAATPIFLAVLATDQAIQASEEESRRVLEAEASAGPSLRPTDEPMDTPSAEPTSDATDRPTEEPNPTASPSTSPTPTTTVGGEGDPLASEIARAVGRPGTYAVIEGTALHAASTVIGAEAERLAVAATVNVADTTSALLEFVDAVELAATQAGRTGDAGGGERNPTVPWLVALAAVGGLAVYGFRRRKI
jgi:hypothetical protein